MKHLIDRTSILPAALFVMAIHAPSTIAASFANLGHAAGAQCVANGVNDNGVAVGFCIPTIASAASVAWVSVSGAEASLAPRASGMACSALGITGAGLIVGICDEASMGSFAVTWSGAAPNIQASKLQPIPGLLGLGADVRTAPQAFSQTGFVGGQSISSNGSRTAVIWRPGSTVAVSVSSRGDNCRMVDMTDTTGTDPLVLMNCPNAQGTTTPRIAAPTGLLGTYVMTDVPKHSESRGCTVVGLSNPQTVGLPKPPAIAGTCLFNSPPLEQAAFWSSPTTTPGLLFYPAFPGDTEGVNSTVTAINHAGQFIASIQTQGGHEGAVFVDPVSNLVIGIPPLHEGARVHAVGLGDNGRVVVNSENAAEHSQPGVFDPSSPNTLAPIPLAGVGVKAAIRSVSLGGAYAVGIAEDANHDANAVITPLP